MLTWRIARNNMTPAQLSELTPDQKRVKIAEACGWKIVHRPGVWPDHYDMTAPDGSTYVFVELRCLPAFATDLNAMHEAEKTLTHDQRIKYLSILGTQVAASTNASLETALWNGTTATAAQRADAFLLATQP